MGYARSERRYNAPRAVRGLTIVYVLTTDGRMCSLLSYAMAHPSSVAVSMCPDEGVLS